MTLSGEPMKPRPCLLPGLFSHMRLLIMTTGAMSSMLKTREHMKYGTLMQIQIIQMYSHMEQVVSLAASTETILSTQTFTICSWEKLRLPERYGKQLIELRPTSITTMLASSSIKSSCTITTAGSFLQIRTTAMAMSLLRQTLWEGLLAIVRPVIQLCIPYHSYGQSRTTGPHTTYTYNFTTGWQTSSTDPNGHTTYYSYDKFGRFVATIYPVVNNVGPQTSYTYNDTGNYLITTNPNGHNVTQRFDGLERLTSVVSYNGSSVYSTQTYTYNYLNLKASVLHREWKHHILLLRFAGFPEQDPSSGWNIFDSLVQLSE